MKSKQFYLDSMQTSFTDEALLKHIESEHRNGCYDATESGKVDGWKARPSMIDRLRPFILHIKMRYSKVASQCHNRLQAHIHVQHQDDQIKETLEANRVLELDHDQLKREIQTFGNKTSSIPYWLLFQLGFSLLLCLVMYLAEIFFITKNLALIGGGFLTNLFIAAGISSGITLVAHFSQRFISSIENKWLRRAAFVGIVGMLIGVFLLLARLRHADFTDVEIELPVWVFVALNLLFFTSIFLLSRYILTPVLAGTKSAFKEFSQAKAIKRKKERFEAIKAEIKENINTLNKHKSIRVNIIEFAKSTQDLIGSYYFEAVAHYIQANAQAQNERPDCLNDDIEPIKLYYTDINFK